MGENWDGELGDGRTTESLIPVTVKGLSNVVSVAMGEEDGLALRADGTVMAWGNDESGQLGTGQTLQERHVPTKVKGLRGVVAIAAGLDYNLALLGNGTVMAWGDNAEGQLGDGEEEGPDQCPGFAMVCARTPCRSRG